MLDPDEENVWLMPGLQVMLIRLRIKWVHAGRKMPDSGHSLRSRSWTPEGDGPFPNSRMITLFNVTHFLPTGLADNCKHLKKLPFLDSCAIDSCAMLGVSTPRCRRIASNPSSPGDALVCHRVCLAAGAHGCLLVSPCSRPRRASLETCHKVQRTRPRKSSTQP